jgi:mono/diheme cytochrome c family protein
LGEIDPAVAAAGQEIFEAKCAACHKMDKRYIGPPMAGVVSRRTPEWIMNMILNPEGMVAEDPDARQLLMEYSAPMANQNLTHEEARQILEYFRTQP